MRPSIFYLYNESSKSDAKLCQELESWLYALYRDERQTSRWHKVLPGGELQVARLRSMQEADLILLLLSADFLSTNDCFEQTLAALRERERDAVVIPILLRPVATTETLPLGQLQVLPRNGVPVIRWRRRDDAWEHICKEIRTVLEHSTLRSVRRSERNKTAVVGSYRIIRTLAYGFASVYEAEHTIFDRRAAIKIIRHLDGLDHAARAMRWEANALAAATHPGVVALYDAGVLSDGAPYIIMELLRGEPLSRSVFASSTETSPSNALLSTLCQVARTLSELHSRGIIHCDLKPQNIIIRTEDGLGARRFDAALIDFGAAELRSVASASERFEKDLLVGTPAYISPEQITDRSAITDRTDVYNFGVVLFELFSGRLPFTGFSAMDVIRRRLGEKTPSLASVLPEVPPMLGQVVDSMLVANPPDRPCMTDVVDALRRVLENCPQLPIVSDSATPQSDPGFTDTLEQPNA